MYLCKQADYYVRMYCMQMCVYKDLKLILYVHSYIKFVAIYVLTFITCSWWSSNHHYTSLSTTNGVSSYY